jgi:hypothetical protein
MKFKLLIGAFGIGHLNFNYKFKVLHTLHFKPMIEEWKNTIH